MKYVYVLTSSDTDCYYEQFLISVTSLRLYNPDACIIALIDSKTKRGLTEKRSEYEKLVSEIKVIDVPCDYSQKEASRWIKTSIHHYVAGDFLFIDCDTVITEKLECDFPSNIIIGAVLDTHVTLDRHHLRENFKKEDVSAGFSSSLITNIRYNGGLIFCRDNPQAIDFFEKWHLLWIESNKRGCSQDMPSLNQANYEKNNITTELDGKWNCQISHNGLPYLHSAKIIHYYATSLVTNTPSFLPASVRIFKKIKDAGTIPFEVQKLIENPRAAFDLESRIIAGKEVLDVVNSNIFAKLLWIRNRKPRLFNSLNRLSSLVKNSRHNQAK